MRTIPTPDRCTITTLAELSDCESSCRPLATCRQVKDFALAGNAYLTIRSEHSGARFTFRITAPRHATTLENRGRAQKPIWFVRVLTGPDNESHYEYLGQIRHDLTFDHGRKSRIARDAQSAVAFAWTWKAIRAEQERVFDFVSIWHEGRCGRCGRKLTAPESIESGIGPECVKRGDK